MNSRLFVPLDVLPGRPPIGSPVVLGGFGIQAGRIYLGECAPGLCMISDNHATPRMWGSGLVALDLSPPTLTDGWPDRIDGYAVAASMLARALGDNGANPARFYPFNRAQRSWVLHTSEILAVFRPFPTTLEPPFDGVNVPALSTIDPADPLADRLALAAVIRAKPWIASPSPEFT